MTDKLIQAAQQALEALKTERDIYREHDEDGAPEYILDAITSIQAALAQPVQEPVACRFCHSKKGCWAWQCYHCGEIDDVQKPAPLPEQEPVGKVVEVNNDGFKCEFSQHLAVGTKLYTAPPQRPWVGLTEDEKFEMAAAQYGWEDLLIAAEAALRSKNT